MNFNELNSFNMSDAVRFHEQLNPAIFDGDHMKQDVREQLLLIANDFIEHLGLPDLAIQDITISGSNAAYSYTNLSDIDLHLLVDMNQFNEDDVYRELFDAKKTVYNDNHDIQIDGYEVELYVQDSNEPVISLGEYSVMNDKWLKLPRKRKADFDQVATKLKYRKLYKLAEYALKSDDPEKINRLIKTVKKYRRIGLDFNGEFGPENIAFKALRNKGIIKKLYEKLQLLHSQRLSLPESHKRAEIKEGVAYHVTPTKNLQSIAKHGLKPTIGDRASQISGEKSGIYVFPDKASAEDAVMNWLGDEFDDEPLTMLKIDLVGLENNISKGADYELIVDTIIEPKRIKKVNINLEEASGYIPSPSEKNDRRWMTALTVDITPYTMQQNAKKLGSKISRAGIPPLLRP